MLDVLERAGFKTEIAFTHWLAKAHHGDKFIDVIFSSGNGVAEVDDEWFAHAVDEEVLGAPVKLCPAEEMIWSKAMIMERERYDGADVAHLFRHCSGLLNWERLVRRFGANWRVLLSHLVLFGFIYPGERALIPSAVMKDLVNRLLAELDVPTRDSKVCQGTLLSRAQYLVDVDDWGYEDARVQPRGNDDRRAGRGVDRRDRQMQVKEFSRRISTASLTGLGDRIAVRTIALALVTRDDDFPDGGRGPRSSIGPARAGCTVAGGQVLEFDSCEAACPFSPSSIDCRGTEDSVRRRLR